MKLSKNIWLQELVPGAIYTQWGNRSQMFVDPRVVNFLQGIRNRFNAGVIINTWHNGGSFHNRGFRDPRTGVGGLLSQHRFGRAADLHLSSGPSVQEIYADIMANQTWYMDQGITTVEEITHTPTWLHVDCRWTGEDKIRIVKP
jgi:hypothetical protein